MKEIITDSLKLKILEDAPAIIAVHDKDQKILWANRAYQEAAGLPLDRIIGKKCWLARGLKKLCTNCPVTIALQTGKSASGELTPENQQHWPWSQGAWLVKAVPLKDDSGVVIGAIETAFEITEKKAKEQKRAIHLREDIEEAERRITRQTEILTALYDAARRLTEKFDLMELAKEIVKTCVEVFGVSLAWLGVTKEDGSVELLTHYPEEISYPMEIVVRWDESPEAQGPTGRAIRLGVPQVVEDALTDPAFQPWREIALKTGRIMSSAAFPLISRGRNFGTLNLYSDKKAFFDKERLDYIMSFTHFAASALQNAQLFEESSGRLKRITALRNIDIAIAGSLDLRVVSRVALDEIVHQLKIDAACILKMDPYTMTLHYSDGRGFHTKIIERTQVSMKEGTAGRIAQERKVIHIPDLSQVDKKLFSRQELIMAEGFVSYYGVPLTTKRRLLGVLEIYHRSPHEENKEWEDFLITLAGQVAIALDNANLVDELRYQHMELLKAYDETIEGWGTALSLKEEETAEHSQRVTEMTVNIARDMGMRNEDLIATKRGAILHDIGKIGVPDPILLKPGKLTAKEWEIMKKHPYYAFIMLAPITYLGRAVDIPYCHHEKWDGTGYPRGLKGKEIPLSARIFAVVDVWDALTSDRPYRKAWPREKVIEHIRNQSGKHFDPEVVECFIKIIN